MRVRPNTITAMSAFVIVGSAVSFGLGQPRLGGLWLLVAGLLDVLDGQVARVSGMVSKFGAFFDSSLDRLGEAVLFTGIAIDLVTSPDQWLPVLGLVFTLATLTGSFLVSYTRARAEGLGLEMRVGLVQRADRILGVGVPTLVFGAGPHGVLLLVIVGVLAMLSWTTVAQRVAYVFQATADADLGPRERPGPAARGAQESKPTS
jgi:CDP-diacylglycerol--glycerol-3-phosphate 3-phosphatidyltransferase